jgi:drug/metabolite transporter (DMT)-like permease
MEQIATVISLFGVVLISQPTAVFSAGDGDTTTLPASGIGEVTHGSGSSTPGDVTPQQRLFGVGCVMMGVLGGGCQLVCLRWIGTRAHPLISVNYLNVVVAIISGGMLTIIPGLSFAIPSTVSDWFYLFVLSASGILLVSFIIPAGVEVSLFNNSSYSNPFWHRDWAPKNLHGQRICLIQPCCLRSFLI